LIPGEGTWVWIVSGVLVIAIGWWFGRQGKKPPEG
jgi:uncharacterized membrane protein YwzB